MDFNQEFERLYKTAFQTGQNAVVLPADPNDFVERFNHKSKLKFLQQCHRGFERAQKDIIRLLQEIKQADISEEEREFRELVLRRVADGIAFQMMQQRTFIARRVVLEPRARNIQMNEIIRYAPIAQKLNDASRLSFALITDLTTFIHVGDILRVDLRKRGETLEFIELKSGKVNNKLQEILEDYSKNHLSLGQLEKDPRLITGEIKQAKRMLKQQIRVEQVKQIVRTDRGTDIKLGVPIRLSREIIITPRYSDVLVELSNEAIENGIASGVINYCLHLGVGYDPNPRKALAKAKFSLDYACRLALDDEQISMKEIRSELLEVLGSPPSIRQCLLFESNLIALSAEPFVMWDIPVEMKMQLVQRKLRIVAGFDLPAFIALCRHMGFNASLSTRKETAKLRDRLGAGALFTWDHRMIRLEKMNLLSGFFSRIVHDLMAPAGLVEAWMDNPVDLSPDS